MRITFVAPPFNLTGGQRAVALLARGLQSRGHRVLVVSPAYAWPSLRELARSLVRRRRLPPLPIPRPPSHFDDRAVPVKILERHRPARDADLPDADVVVATWWETAEWVAALGPRKGTKVHFMMDHEIWGGPVERVEATCRLPMPKILIAEWVGAVLSDRYDFHDHAVVGCGVDLDVFHAPPRDKQSVPTVGFVYTYLYNPLTGKDNKGTDVCVAAIERARRALPDLRAVSFGSNAPVPDLPLPAGCAFHRRVPNDQLRSIYGACDAWLFGTRIEGYGLPILEAMACRAPVIGTPAGAAPELLAGGGGIAVPHEDPDAMARAIVEVAEMEPRRWRALSDAALATARRHTWDDVTDRFEAALERVVAEGHARPRPAAERLPGSCGLC